MHDPSSPEAIGWWADPLPARPSALAVAGEARLFYVREDAMLLLDVRDAAQPKVVDHWSTIEKKWYVGNAMAVDARCYLAARYDGVLVLDSTPP